MPLFCDGVSSECAMPSPDVMTLTHRGELNLYGMVDAQIVPVEGELLAGTTLARDSLSLRQPVPTTGCPNSLILHRKHVANAESSSNGWLAPKPGFGSDK